MKKSLTENRDMTFGEFMKLFIYRPYGDVLEYMVDSDERIHIKGDTWIVIIDHNTGDFYFSGELHKYYSVDTVVSIRDLFGDIYSVFNMKYDRVERDTWMKIEDEREEVPAGPPAYEIVFSDIEKKRRMLQRKKDYYWANRDRINSKRKDKYRKSKES